MATKKHYDSDGECVAVTIQERENSVTFHGMQKASNELYIKAALQIIELCSIHDEHQNVIISNVQYLITSGKAEKIKKLRSEILWLQRELKATLSDVFSE